MKTKPITKQLKYIKSFGSSMYPLLLNEDTVYLKSYSFSSLQVNDIITFRLHNILLTHRIIYKKSNYLITRGDNNASTDGKIYKGQILGKVYKVKRKGIEFNPDTYYLFQSTIYFNEIVKIKKIFEKNNISFIFLKGLPLYLHFTKKYPRRNFADCDILIDDKQLQTVEKLFNQAGYFRHEKTYSNLHAKLKDKQIEISFKKSVQGFIVTFDIHLEPAFLLVQIGTIDALYPKSLIDELTNAMLVNTEIVTIEDEKFSILSKPYLLLYLALNFFHDNYSGYHKLLLLSVILKKYKSNQRTILKVIEIIRYYKLQNYVYPTYLLLWKYYGEKFPTSYLKQIEPDRKIVIYIRKKILTKNIFNEFSRLKTGLIRFKYIFALSPNPLYKKLGIVFNIQILYMVFWILKKKVLGLRLNNFFIK